MSPKNKIMLIVGAVLGIMYLLMFRYQLISAQFHEIGGLALFALVLTHVFMNRARIKSFIANFENKPFKARAQIVVDALFGVAMLAVIGTGVAMAHTLPVALIAHSGVIKITHTVASFVGLALMGVHLGLNWSWVTNKLKQLIPMSTRSRRTLAYTTLAFTLLVGIAAASNLSFKPTRTDVRSESASASSTSSDNTYHGQTVCPKTGATSNCSNCHNTSASPFEGGPRGKRGGHRESAQVQDEQFF